MTAAKVEGFIHGAHHLSPAPGGLVCPQRLSAKQFDVAKAAGRDRAASYTAGVTIRLVTTGDELSFDLAVLRPLHYASDCVAETVERAEAAGDARAAEAGVVDGIDLVVDGRYVCTAPVADGPLTLRFENPTHAPAEVCVYLPCLMSVAVGNLATNGSLEQAPERPYLLALGDSITQGYVVGAPSMSWPARLARSCGLDLVNQAIAGHHFDAGTLRGMGVMRTRPPALVVVAYGTNDWSHAPDKRVLAANMKKYLRRLAQRFEGTPIYVLTPIWRADEGEARPHGKSLAWVRETIADNCRKLGLRCIDGSNLVARDRSLFADGRLHPNATGAGSMAAGVLAALERDGILAQLGGRHDTPGSPGRAAGVRGGRARHLAAAPGRRLPLGS